MMLTFGYVGLDKTGDSLEDPFGTDLCDLPLENYLRRMADTTRALIISRFGDAAADVPDVAVDLIQGGNAAGNQLPEPSGESPSAASVKPVAHTKAGGYQAIGSLNADMDSNEV